MHKHRKTDSFCQRFLKRNIPSNTAFLSERELSLCKYLFCDLDGLHDFGGYADAQRRILVYLPDYLDRGCLMQDNSPVACLRAHFYENDTPTHRDFLGALIGSGIARECIGDICVSSSFCDFFVTAEIAPYILHNFAAAGRTKLRVEQIALIDAEIPEPTTIQILDTVASLRLDSVVSSGFKIARTQAVQHITSGRVAVNGIPCEKADKPIEENSAITIKGLGKIRLTSVGGQSKKGRIFVVIDRYV